MLSLLCFAVFWTALTVCGGCFFGLCLRKFLKWRASASISTRRQILLMLPPLLLISAVFVPNIASIPGKIPVPQKELLQVTASVESIRTYTSRVLGRGGARVLKRFRINLDGYTNSLYIPDYYRFDQDAFLRWAGTDPVTFLYARRNGQLIPYQIELPGGAVFLDYEQSYIRLLLDTMEDIGSYSLFLLMALGCTVYLPAHLYPWKKEDRRRNRLDVLVVSIFLVGFLVGLPVFGRFVSQPAVTETPAAPSDPVTLELRQDLYLTLPRGWAERKETSQTDTKWYRIHKEVSTCFRLTNCICDVPETEWSHTHLADYRAYLLETFIKTPREDSGPFLTELVYSSDFAPGTEYIISTGTGTSANQYKDHFLVVFLPKMRCMLTIQSSSKHISWDGLAEYAEEYIWPLLYGLEPIG